MVPQELAKKQKNCPVGNTVVDGDSGGGSEKNTASTPPTIPGGAGGSTTSMQINTTPLRFQHDKSLREHLLVQMTPNKVRLTVAAATMFVARAQLAKKVVEERKDESGVAAMYEGKQEEAMRDRMSREEKIEDGLKLLRERVDNIKVKVIHMEDDGNCQFRSLAAELFGSQRHHALVRSRVVEYMA
eukprot:gene18636-18733_t